MLLDEYPGTVPLYIRSICFRSTAALCKNCLRCGRVHYQCTAEEPCGLRVSK